MKLTKNKLIRITKNGLRKFGYIEVRDTITGAQGLYVKLVNDNFFLSVGLTISKYYDSMFTASFYLSKTTTWSAVWGDIPESSYRRIGRFLLKEERSKLLSEEYAREGVVDAWWDASNEQMASNFLEALQISERRFLEQPYLFNNITTSKEVNKLANLAKLVIADIDFNSKNDYNYKFIPKKSIDDIPMEWFKTAERIIAQKKGNLNANAVKLLAADAYRQKMVLSQSG
jgi:hypothetical protein